MWSILDRPVWDCLIPAAIREDIVLPELRNAVSSFDSDDSALSHNRGKTPYERALLKREKKKTRELGEPEDDGGAIGFLSGLLLGPEDPIDGINPPPIYFDMHKIPKAPTWSDKEVDQDWLPSAPSLAYDEYSISGNGSKNSQS
mmetsp:Transcript_29452/g.70806  ORF Transcript_29452/g.70806 Transcript_29452/m.70806 type:complete len:144 (+) Transcript_29452:632-1063(+)